MQVKESDMSGNCVKISGRKYTWRTYPITNSGTGSVIIPDNCNAWLVENYGGVRALINSKPLLPPPGAGLSGESFGMNGNDGDCFVGEISITFDACANPLVHISFMIYL